MALLNSTTRPPTPPAYFMCSEQECSERQSSGEVSIFESQWPPPPNGSRRTVNPHYAMTKYRRSAAGLKDRLCSRSWDRWLCCLDHLEYILCYQQQPPPKDSPNLKDSFPKQTLTGTVSFVEDRIRAIQVDLTVSQQPSAVLQYRIAKCHILILYLLGNVQSYPAKLGHQALAAALANYWEEEASTTDNSNKIRMDDEILCFMALQNLCQFYQDAVKSESTLSNILNYYRTNAQTRTQQQQQQQLHKYPKFRWALNLVQLAATGQPRSIIRQCSELGKSAFAILCRCCLAPVLDRLRFQALNQYNQTYMKGEKVKCQEIARLLYFQSPGQAGDFAQTMAGLTRNHQGDHDEIVFKVGPVQASEKLDTTRQDEFVFGDLYHHASWDHGGSGAVQQVEVIKDAWDDPDPDPPTLAEEPIDESLANTEARTDEEGVLVPPPWLLYSVLRNEIF